MNTGNLNLTYQLRLDRLNRLREKFRRGSIHEGEFRELLAVEGIMDRASQDVEIREAHPGLRPLSEIVGRIMERVRP